MNQNIYDPKSDIKFQYNFIPFYTNIFCNIMLSYRESKGDLRSAQALCTPQVSSRRYGTEIFR